MGDALETSDHLFRLLKELVGECPASAKKARDGQPAFLGIKPIDQRIPGLGFFPGGDGLWKEAGCREPVDRNSKSVMVVGSTFGCLKYFDEINAQSFPEENRRKGTWRPLLSLLGENRNRSFFTNAFPGLLNGEKNIDCELRPADFDPKFLSQSRDFFSTQVELTQPKVILFLGKFSPFVIGQNRLAQLGWLEFMDYKRGCVRKFETIDSADKAFVAGFHWSDVSPDVGVALLLHPCNRHLNLKHRRLKYSDEDPEPSFLCDVLRVTGA